MKTMEYPNWSNDSGDVLVGFVIGVICAVIKLLDIHLLADAYMIVLFKVFLTAIIGGAGGVVGKHLITYLIKKWKDKFKNKKPNQS